MTPKTGDIVTIWGRKGYHVISDTQVPSPRGFPPDCKAIIEHQGLQQSHTAHPTAFTVVFRPTITPGDRWRHNGEPVELVEDRGDDVVIRGQRNTKALRGGGNIIHDLNVAYVSKGALVLENLRSILKG